MRTCVQLQARSILPLQISPPGSPVTPALLRRATVPFRHVHRDWRASRRPISGALCRRGRDLLACARSRKRRELSSAYSVRATSPVRPCALNSRRHQGLHRCQIGQEHGPAGPHRIAGLCPGGRHAGRRAARLLLHECENAHCNKHSCPSHGMLLLPFDVVVDCVAQLIGACH